MRIASSLPSKRQVYAVIAWSSAVAFGIASVLNIMVLLAVGLRLLGND